jgi:hypothetical protein
MFTTKPEEVIEMVEVETNSGDNLMATLTPSLKGQLTKALKAQAEFARINREVTIDSCLEYGFHPEMRSPHTAVLKVFMKIMPAEIKPKEE